MAASTLDFGVIDTNWTDAAAQRAGWRFEDQGGRHVPFADAVRSVGTFALSTNGSDNKWDVAYYDDIKIESIQEPESLPRIVPRVGVPAKPPIQHGAMPRELHGGVVINVPGRKQLFLNDLERPIGSLRLAR